MRKFIYQHQWLSFPDSQGISHLGLTQFAKDYFLRFQRVDHARYFPTSYGIANRYIIDQFLEIRKSNNNLTVSEKMEIDRFLIKQGQPYSLIKTREFDVELSAPVDMRVLQINFEVDFDWKVYAAPWIYRVQVMQPQQLQGLMSEEEYEKSNKIITYEGMLP